MKIVINIFCLAATLLIFYSCTVTKRHFGGGYHVEWKKKWNEDESMAKSKKAETDTLDALSTLVSKADLNQGSSQKETGSSEKEIETATEEPVVNEPKKLDQTASYDGLITDNESVPEVKADSAADELPKDAAPKKKVEKLTWVSFAFLLAGIGFGLLPVSLFTSLTLPLILLALLFLIAFINAVSSAMRIKRTPDKYKAKGFTWLMVFFCSLGLAFALVFLITNTLFPVY